VAFAKAHYAGSRKAKALNQLFAFLQSCSLLFKCTHSMLLISDKPHMTQKFSKKKDVPSPTPLSTSNKSKEAWEKQRTPLLLS
jgi:hypothetical protein